MKNTLLYILFFASITCCAQEKNIYKKVDYISILTNDSVKYWDFVCRNDTDQTNKIGLCFNKNHSCFLYEYFRNIKFQRIYYDYVLDSVFPYKMSNDTIYLTSYTKAGYKIEYISNDSLILGVFNCYKDKYEYETYKPSNDQKSEPMPVDYWYKIYKDSILNKQNDEINNE